MKQQNRETVNHTQPYQNTSSDLSPTQGDDDQLHEREKQANSDLSSEISA